MNRLFFAVVILLVLCSACGNRHIGSQLNQAEELIVADELDSALTIIESIDSTAIPDDADRAHYYMLNTRLLYCLYKPVSDTTQIRWAANYYSTHDNDKVKFANTYYYLGMLELEKNETVEAARHLKKAEEAAQLTDNLNLRHKIYDALSTLNFRTENFSLALKYANMTLDCARKTGNNLWLAYSYNHLACIHDLIGNPDSA